MCVQSMVIIFFWSGIHPHHGRGFSSRLRWHVCGTPFITYEQKMCVCFFLSVTCIFFVSRFWLFYLSFLSILFLRFRIVFVFRVSLVGSLVFPLVGNHNLFIFSFVKKRGSEAGMGTPACALRTAMRLKTLGRPLQSGLML